MNFTRSILIFVCSLLFFEAYAAPTESLRLRQPNWRTKILESFPEGGIRKVLFYEPVQDGSDVPVKVVTYYPSGQIRNETDLTVLPEGHSSAVAAGTTVVPQGFSVDYWPNGVAAKVSFFDQGILHGNTTSYDETSSLTERGSYDKGKLTGPFDRFYSDGSKRSQAHYRDGVLEGEMTEWHPNGVIKSIQFYRRGLLNGDRQKLARREYNESRTLINTQDFRFGRPYGMIGGKGSFLPEAAESHVEDNNMSLAPALDVAEKAVRSMPDGEWKLYYPSSQEEEKIEQILQVKDGQFHGVQKTFYPNGQLKTLITYRQGILDGQKAFWSPQGEVLEEGFYCNGDLEGRYYQRRPDGIETVSHYRNHRLNGIEQSFYTVPGSDTNVKVREAAYRDGLLDGELSTYNREGIKVSSSLYKQGKREGVSTLYSSDGRVMVTAEYRNDRKNGLGSEFFPNGNLRSQTPFLDDLEEGEEKVFFEEGTLAAQRVYRQGKLDGTAREWDRSGKLIFEAEYRNGMKHGHFLKYDAAADKWIDRVYDNDRS